MQNYENMIKNMDYVIEKFEKTMDKARIEVVTKTASESTCDNYFDVANRIEILKLQRATLMYSNDEELKEMAVNIFITMLKKLEGADE